MACGKFKYLPRRTASADKVLLVKGFNIAKSPKHDEYQKGLTAIVYEFFDRKFSGARV